MGRISSENYVTIQGWMVEELGLKGNELIIYAIIYGFSQDGENNFHGGLQYLADWTNCTKQGVMRCLKSLCDKDYIEKIDKIINNVKFCEYTVKQTARVCNKVEWGIKQSLIGGKESLMGGIKQSLPNNKYIDNKNNNKDNIYIDEFEQLWKMYPNKKGKDNALKAYTKARKDGTTFDDVKKGIENYNAFIKQEKIETQYIKHGSTYFNQHCWNDEYSVKQEEQPQRSYDLEKAMQDSFYNVPKMPPKYKGNK